MVSWDKDTAYANWNKQCKDETKEAEWPSWKADRNDGKWARTDDGNQQGRQGACGSSGADGDSAAPAANGGFQIRMSQLSDRKGDGTGPAWEDTKPPRLYMVVRHDLDTMKFVPSDVHRMAKDTNTFLFQVWNSATNGYQPKVRSHFYHCTSDFNKAKQRAEQGNQKNNRKFWNASIVVIDVWDLFKQNKIKDEEFIDLSSLEAQRRFFDEAVISNDNLNSLTYQANYNEYMLCWKGMFLDFWYMTDPNGNPIELLKPLLDYDEATHTVRGWADQNRPAGGGAQPSPPEAAAHTAPIQPSGAPGLHPSTTVGATTMDSRPTADLAQNQAMSVTDTAAAAGSAPSNASTPAAMQ
jgi:hypothetical protein